MSVSVQGGQTGRTELPQTPFLAVLDNRSLVMVCYYSEWHYWATSLKTGAHFRLEIGQIAPSMVLNKGEEVVLQQTN